MIDVSESKRRFVIFYEKYRYLMQKAAMDVLHDRFLAEDAVHNTFMNLTMYMNDIGEPESSQAKRYLITMVKNVAIDLYRKRKVQVQREIHVDELEEKDMPRTYMEVDLGNAVLDILKNLPAKYRNIFLKYSSHLENSEIARLCGIQEGTVRQRISRGKVLIEKELNELDAEAHEKNNSNG